MREEQPSLLLVVFIKYPSTQRLSDYSVPQLYLTTTGQLNSRDEGMGQAQTKQRGNPSSSTR